MLSALSNMLGRPSGPSSQALTTLNEVATTDVVLDGLRDNTVVDTRFHEYNKDLWLGLGKQYFPHATTPQMTDPISFFNTQQNLFSLPLLTQQPGEEILARKQLAVGLLLKSFAIRKPDLPFGEILKGIATGPAMSLEKEALQTAVMATLEFDPAKARHNNTDLEVVLTAYLGREQQVQVMFGQMLAQMEAKLKAWGLEMAALNSYFALAQFLITCDAQLVRDKVGKITAQVALRGNLRMVELLYPHIHACECDVSPKFCVLEKAALARQREVVAYLLRTHAEDFPTEERVKLLQSMATQDKGEVVTFLLTEFRPDFSAVDILSLRGTPGFESSDTSYWQLLGAPAMQRVGGFLGSFWRSNGAPILENAGALVPSSGASSVGTLTASSAPAPTATIEKESDGSDHQGRRKKLAITGSVANTLSNNAPTLTPAAAAAATASPSPFPLPLSAEHVSGALVPYKKRSLGN